MAKKRIKWLDFAKGFTIFFVVLLHSLGAIHDNPNYMSQRFIRGLLYIVQIFVMPIFFSVSGYLYKPTNILKKFLVMMYKKTSSFLIPYLFFNILVIFLQHTHNISLFIKILIFKSYGILLFPSSWLWFLYALFFIFVMVGLMDLFRLPLYIQIVFSFLIISFGQIKDPLTYVFEQNTTLLNPRLGGYYLVKGITGYLICFYMGSIIHRLHLDKKMHRKYLSLILIIIFGLLIKMQPINGDVNILTYENMDIKLFSIIVFFVIFINFNHDKLFKYFTNYGRYTLAIYLIHYPIITLIIPLICKIFHFTFILEEYPLISLFIYFVPSWILSILCSNIIKKIKILDFIFYPRKYINYFIKDI